ncbi:hypothetical protein [Actinoplanes utahensis]|nr:hypothetical protein [Actinoplanes utahensis]GIF32500.1 hypothetical protein Aut01nite_54860 [Actinoplanes utahensis]
MDPTSESPSLRRRMRRWAPALICVLALVWILWLAVLISGMPTVE